MMRRPPVSPRTATLFPYTPRFRSRALQRRSAPGTRDLPAPREGGGMTQTVTPEASPSLTPAVVPVVDRKAPVVLSIITVGMALVLWFGARPGEIGRAHV